MVVVQLGEDVRSVRWKIGMEANEYLSPWRLINVGVSMASRVCQADSYRLKRRRFV